MQNSRDIKAVRLRWVIEIFSVSKRPTGPTRNKKENGDCEDSAHWTENELRCKDVWLMKLWGGRGILAKFGLSDMIGSGMYNVFGIRLLCAPLFESQCSDWEDEWQKSVEWRVVLVVWFWTSHSGTSSMKRSVGPIHCKGPALHCIALWFVLCQVRDARCEMWDLRLRCRV